MYHYTTVAIHCGLNGCLMTQGSWVQIQQPHDLCKPTLNSTMPNEYLRYLNPRPHYRNSFIWYSP